MVKVKRPGWNLEPVPRWVATNTLEARRKPLPRQIAPSTLSRIPLCVHETASLGSGLSEVEYAGLRRREPARCGSGRERGWLRASGEDPAQLLGPAVSAPGESCPPGRSLEELFDAVAVV